MSDDVIPQALCGRSFASTERDPLHLGLFHYIVQSSWAHQVPLVALTVAVFLLEVVPLELQRRVVNDIAKHRHYSTVIGLCAAYAAAAILQGTIKLGLNVYRSWIGERTKRDLRQRICNVGPTATSEEQGTAVSMLIAEVEPVGGFIGSAFSEPLLQAGVLATVVAYIVHVDLWMGAAALTLFIPQLVFVPLMQHAMNRRTGIRIWLLRQIGSGLISQRTTSNTDAIDDRGRIERVFRLNMSVLKFKFSMNFLMNLCSHLQIAAALLIGGWWVLNEQLEIGGVVAFISGIGRLIDPWGDLVNYFREVSLTRVRYRLITDAVNGTAS